MNDQYANGKTVIGRQEYCDLPDLGLTGIRVKIDSGAKTSALHAYNIQTSIGEGGVRFVSFNTHPENRRRKDTPRITLPVKGVRRVTSSNGECEERYLVETVIHMGGGKFMTEMTLTSRHKMSFPVLLGRNTLIKGRFIIDVSRGYLLGKAETSAS